MNARRTSWALLSIAVVALITVASSIGIAQAQCNSTTCGEHLGKGPGDINADDTLDVHDVLGLAGYVLKRTWELPSKCNAEIDGLCNPYWGCEPSLGDVAWEIEHIFIARIDFQDCVTAGEAPLLGDIVAHPRYMNVPESPSGLHRFEIYVRNDGSTTRNLYGYSIPLQFTLTRAGSTGAITNLQIVDWYLGPANGWQTFGIDPFVHSENLVFAGAAPSNTLTPVTLAPGDSLRLLAIDVSYTTGAGADGPRLEAGMYQDPSYPGHVPVLISETGSSKGASAVGSTTAELLAFEEEQVANAEPVPVTSGPIRTLMALLLGLVGFGLIWRYTRVGAVWSAKIEM
ncbi:MAG: hypothetical protein GF341_06690 [candidate division Zixibacteria bacterium]|nr:hypothetical protein [candidate division Zixibacteria bacterium]